MKDILLITTLETYYTNSVDDIKWIKRGSAVVVYETVMKW